MDVIGPLIFWCIIFIFLFLGRWDIGRLNVKIRDFESEMKKLQKGLEEVKTIVDARR